MYKKFAVAVSIIFAIGFTGCIKEPKEPKNEAQNKPAQPEQLSPFIGAVTGQTLPDFGKKKIGAVFEGYRYFTSRDWKETRSSSGKVYVDFTGLFEEQPSLAGGKGVVKNGVQIKFVIDMKSGNFYAAMASKVDVKADGSMAYYPLEDMKKVISLIYANERITF